ncbi:hypothetical protein [Cystobacter fuscus]|uniref:hypothetical protein n=1 Tax=Cystobacter fuscus TaxID=43 RepID=UPI0012FE309E
MGEDRAQSLRIGELDRPYSESGVFGGWSGITLRRLMRSCTSSVACPEVRCSFQSRSAAASSKVRVPPGW